MRNNGDSPAGESAEALPSGFKYVIGASALFIAGCSAFFSVRGLGLLFVGASTAVMIMAASLEVGKLVAASFLYRYWRSISGALKFYLSVAVIVLIGITSLGNYGYLARAYERTHTRVGMLENQVASVEREAADIQRQIDAARGQQSKSTDIGRDDVAQLQQRITQANQAAAQSLTAVQERRQAAQTRRDRDIQVITERVARQTDVLNQSIATETAAVAELAERVAVLDRAVDAYTKQGGPGFFKLDSIKKGQELRDQQKRERDQIAAKMAAHRERQETLRAEHAKLVAAAEPELAAVRQQFDQETARLDTEETALRQATAEAVTRADQQLAGLQAQGTATLAAGDTQVDALYQRLRSREEESRRLRDQIAATDIGSYRFVARAFEAPADDVVKWLMLALVIVFDPLAVCLAVGFNVALLRDRPRRASPLAHAVPVTQAMAETATPVASGAAPAARRSRWTAVGTGLVLFVVGSSTIALAARYGVTAWRDAAHGGHVSLVPADSFAVLTLRPAELAKASQGANGLEQWLGPATGGAITAGLPELLRNGFDARADVYAFARFPQQREVAPGKPPVILAGLVARVTNPAAAEAALLAFADRVQDNLRPAGDGAAAPRVRSHAMIRHGRGRYLDPEGGFFTCALTDQAAVLLLELDGDPRAPRVETEMQACLAWPGTDQPAEGAALPARATSRDGALALWLDADRFFSGVTRTPAAQARYQQLQRFLEFDLVLKVRPAGERLNVTADYAYHLDRFPQAKQPGPLDLLAKLGAPKQADLGTRLIDRCADTLDYESLIERLRGSLGSGTGSGLQQVGIEKSFASEREARFVLSARFDGSGGAPLVAALHALRD